MTKKLNLNDPLNLQKHIKLKSNFWLTELVQLYKAFQCLKRRDTATQKQKVVNWLKKCSKYLKAIYTHKWPTQLAEGLAFNGRKDKDKQRLISLGMTSNMAKKTDKVEKYLTDVIEELICYYGCSSVTTNANLPSYGIIEEQQQQLSHGEETTVVPSDGSLTHSLTTTTVPVVANSDDVTDNTHELSYTFVAVSSVY
jgi:hypothetical protein